MENDNARLILVGIVLAIFIPQIVTLLSMNQNQRFTSPDKNCGDKALYDGNECVCIGLNQSWDGEKCVCDECYGMDTNGECNECMAHCAETKDEYGNRVCLSKIHEDEVGNRQTQEQYRSYRIEDALMKPQTELFSARAFKNEEVPGPYPSFDGYKQIYSTDMQNVILSNEQAALNANKIQPFLSNSKATKLPDRSYNIDINREEHEPEQPEKEYIIHTGINPRDSAIDYAANTLSMNSNYDESQLTEWSTGDVMTGYKPINELHRPVSTPQLTNRLPERENTQTLSGIQPILNGPVQSAVFDVKKKPDILGREMYPTTGNTAETSLYWQSELPERGPSKLNEMEMWQVGNPLYKVQSDVPTRSTEIRNAREITTPSTSNPGFYGNVLDPMKDISNSSRSFYSTNGFQKNDYEQLRNKSDRMTRDNYRLIPEPRTNPAELDENLIRNSETIRATSNKVYNNSVHSGNRDLYANKFDQLPPSRSMEISQQKRDSSTIQPYSFADVSVPFSNMLNREDILSIGPAHI